MRKLGEKAHWLLLITVVFMASAGCSSSKCKKELLEISSSIHELIDQRIEAVRKGDEEKVRTIDRKLATFDDERQECLHKYVVEQNSLVKSHSPDESIYKVVLEQSNVKSPIYGNLISLLDIKEFDPRVYEIGDSILTKEDVDFGLAIVVQSRLLVSGSTIQQRVIQFPADIDYIEELFIEAPTRHLAGATLSNLLQQTLLSVRSDTTIEFEKMIVGLQNDSPLEWSESEILRGAKIEGDKTYFLSDLMVSSNIKWINTFWRGYIRNGVAGEFTKVLIIAIQLPNEVMPQFITEAPLFDLFDDPDSILGFEEEFVTETRAYQFNAGYLSGTPPISLRNINLGEFLHAIRTNSAKWLKEREYIKTLKRVYAYSRASNDISCMEQHALPILSERSPMMADAAAKEITFLSKLMEPDSLQTQIVLAKDVEDQLVNIAVSFKEQDILPEVSDELQRFVNDGNVPSTPDGLLGKNADAAERLALSAGMIKPYIGGVVGERTRGIYQVCVEGSESTN